MRDEEVLIHHAVENEAVVGAVGIAGASEGASRMVIMAMDTMGVGKIEIGEVFTPEAVMVVATLGEADGAMAARITTQRADWKIWRIILALSATPRAIERRIARKRSEIIILPNK